MKVAKTAVVYYSYHGNTGKVAEEIADITGADLFELKIPGVEGLKGFRMYARLGFLASFKRKPRIMGEADLSGYDTVILGSPVWAGTFSPALRTFLSNQPLSSKKQGAYFCHKGGLGKAPANLDAFLKLDGSLIHSQSIDPAKKGTARTLAEDIIGKMNL